MERSALMEAWKKASDRERAEVVAALCSSHPTLICRILVDTRKCKIVKPTEILATGEGR